ncbi:MAG: hypothetical protein WD737_03170 [Gemmatimonadota bacterium]
MSLASLQGHSEIRELLARALRAGALPQSILLHGPPGVGKERLGLWLAQLLVCDAEASEPCGACAACRLVGRLEHPDVHWFFPLPRPDGASSPDKLRSRLEEQRAEELQRWRDDPFHQPEFEKAPAHFLAAVRSMHHVASVRPAVGRRKVFVIGDAELMVPQESSPEAANAFLKLLEEPPPSTTLILTSSHPGALLPTIRSRVLAVRVGLLSEVSLRRLLVDGGLVPADEALPIARRARGSARRAIHLARAEGDGESDERSVGRELLLAALTSGPLARLGLAHDRRPTGARSDLVGELDSLSEWLRDLLAVASGAHDRVIDPASLPILTRAVGQRNMDPAGIMAGIERVAKARDLASGNVNPQLILTDLLQRLQKDLESTGSSSAGART